jgi:hydrogenase small subunit
MNISRRQFLKYCSIAAGAIGLTSADLLKLEKATAAVGGLPAIWINGQSCTGCTVSLANSVYYQTLQELTLLNDPSLTLELKYIETLSAAMGTQATQQAGLTSSAFVLCIEGAIPTLQSGHYCEIGSYTGAASETMQDVVSYLATNSNCAAVLCMGTCAAFGGIPAAVGNLTGAKGFLDFIGSVQHTTTYRAIRAKTINIPGCPPNPNWMVGTIAYVLSRFQAEGVKVPALDSLRRPRLYYGERICNYCDRFNGAVTAGFVGIDTAGGWNRMTVNRPDEIGDHTKNQDSAGYCLKLAGCKGSRTKSDCSIRKWHSPGFMQSGINWCVGAGAPCQGCTQNYFPDRMSPFQYIR